MDTQTAVPAAEPAAAPEHVPATEITAPSAPERLSLSESARILRAARAKKADEPAAPPAATPPPAEAAAPPEPTAAPAEPAETQVPPPEAPAEPAVEPPGTWTPDAKAAFRALPPEHQKAIAESERVRAADAAKARTDIDGERKTVDAEREKMIEARNQYEAALPALLQSLQTNPEFADIKTQADVEKMATEDWARYIRWDMNQKRVAAVQQEILTAKGRQEAEAAQQWQHFAKREDELFLEKSPEMRDPTKAAKARESAVTMLKDMGFTPEELGKLWSTPALRDHRIQLIILEAAKFRDARAAAIAAAKAPLPPVQRPGVVNPGKAQEEKLAGLKTRFETSGSLKDAAAFLAAKRKG